MSLQRTGEEIKSAVDNHLLVLVTAFRTLRWEKISAALGGTSSFSSKDQKKESALVIVLEILKKLQAVIEQDNDSTLAHLIISGVGEAVQQLPVTFVLEQQEKRFKSNKQDEWYLKVGKSVFPLPW